MTNLHAIIKKTKASIYILFYAGHLTNIYNGCHSETTGESPIHISHLDKVTDTRVDFAIEDQSQTCEYQSNPPRLKRKRKLFDDAIDNAREKKDYCSFREGMLRRLTRGSRRYTYQILC